MGLSLGTPELAWTEETLDGVDAPWVLVVGGVSTQGHRLARRIAEAALRKGCRVLWLDGLVGAEDGTNDGDDSGGAILSLRYGEAESETFAARLAHPAREDWSAARSWLWRRFGRRIGNLLRPLASWQVVRGPVRRLKRLPPPTAIALCDESAIPTAWHAARYWPASPVITDIEQL